MSETQYDSWGVPLKPQYRCIGWLYRTYDPERDVVTEHFTRYEEEAGSDALPVYSNDESAGYCVPAPTTGA